MGGFDTRCQGVGYVWGLGFAVCTTAETGDVCFKVTSKIFPTKGGTLPPIHVQ